MSDEENNLYGFSVSQWRLFTVVLAVGLSFAAFWFLRDQGINDTAALYVGVPLFFALAISLTPKTKTTVGAAMKGMAIALFLSAPVLQEGFICILFASPILFSIVALVAWMTDQIKKKVDRSRVRFSAVVTVLLIASLEGTPYEIYSFTNDYQVSYTEIVDKDIKSVRRNISNPAFTNENKPLFLRVFPFPVNFSGQGLHVGAEHKIDFVYKKWIVTNEHTGSTVFRVAESTDKSIRFDISQDTSYLSHYMTWKSSRVELRPVSDSKTEIRWTLSFTRDLDPAWYFGPLQTYAAYLSAKVLVKNAAS